MGNCDNDGHLAYLVLTYQLYIHMVFYIKFRHNIPNILCWVPRSAKTCSRKTLVPQILLMNRVHKQKIQRPPSKTCSNKIKKLDTPSKQPLTRNCVGGLLFDDKMMWHPEPSRLYLWYLHFSFQITISHFTFLMPPCHRRH